jgi:hypothetical protein
LRRSRDRRRNPSPCVSSPIIVVRMHPNARRDLAHGVSLIMCTGGLHRPFLHDRHFSAGSSFRIGVSRERRIASSGMPARVLHARSHRCPSAKQFAPGGAKLDHALLMRPMGRSRNVVRVLAATLVPEHCSSGHCGKFCRWSHLISSAQGPTQIVGHVLSWVVPPDLSRVTKLRRRVP